MLHNYGILGQEVDSISIRCLEPWSLANGTFILLYANVLTLRQCLCP